MVFGCKIDLKIASTGNEVVDCLVLKIADLTKSLHQSDIKTKVSNKGILFTERELTVKSMLISTLA